MEQRPIIVKRVKKSEEGGHHGGAWKVAFADFATAMMAFFMVLWLLTTASPIQKEAIEGYFRDPVGFISGGAPVPIDLGGSPEIAVTTNTPPAETNEQASQTDEAMAEASMEETVPTEASVVPSDGQIEPSTEQVEQQTLETLLSDLEKKIENSEALREFKDQLMIDMTESGLRIQIVDKSKRPMFDVGQAHLKDYSEDILFELAEPIGSVPNRINISGHTDATPFSEDEEGYSNWELSADRANAARRALIAGGLARERIARVVGLSSSVLFDQKNPEAPINRRISIIILNKKAEQRIQQEENWQPDGADPQSTIPSDLPSEIEESIEEVQPIPRKDLAW
ncbi:MAG: flagellar motor protein MotB [Hahellaceae bacterium]|nr:flagellar motor protein MotB [Hahellaceae bacterium]